MSPLIVVLGVVLAFAAALRSTWSPCGLSMLSTITPLAETARGHRYAATASWFVAGAVVGGATTGLLAAGLAAVLAPLDASPAALLGVLALAALAGAAVDGGLFGRLVPFHKRQVDDAWLRQFRAWVYGGGFGFQIGTGLMTYIMTTAVLGVILAAALTATPWMAFAIVTLFGTLRGLVVLLGSRITSPMRLADFHRRFDAWREPVRLALVVVLGAVAAVAAVGAWGLSVPAAGVVLAAVAVTAAGVRKPAPVGGQTPVPDAVPSVVQPA